MINGLYIEMDTEKLRAHLAKQRDYHRTKAVWYKQQADNLMSEIAEQNVSGNPVSTLRQHQTSHEGKVAFFSLLVENLIPNETYRLSQEDCILLDLRSRYLQ